MKVTPKKDKVTFQTEMDRALAELSKHTPDSDEYAKAVKNIEVLAAARAHKANDAPSMDTILVVGANLIGILVMLNYEQMHIITSKTLNFIVKGRTS